MGKCDTIAAVKDGWITCPICRSKLKKVRLDESADLIYLHCRQCKNDIPITLKKGQCFQSRGQRDS